MPTVSIMLARSPALAQSVPFFVPTAVGAAKRTIGSPGSAANVACSVLVVFIMISCSASYFEPPQSSAQLEPLQTLMFHLAKPYPASGTAVTFTVALKFGGSSPLAPLEVRDSLLITQVITLALRLLLESYGLEVRIKWPNDIYAGSRKICGMLFENSLSEGLVSTSIVGIGVNLNQTEFDSSIANPTSLAIETGKVADRNQSLSELLVMLRARYENFANGAVSREALHAEYLSKLFRYGEFHKFQKLTAGPDPLNVSYANSTFENVFEARISNVKENGLLVLENREGREIEFAFKEVKFLL